LRENLGLRAVPSRYLNDTASVAAE
jgi:hypothetical protein